MRIFSDGEDAAKLTAKVDKVIAALAALAAACLCGSFEVRTTVRIPLWRTAGTRAPPLALPAATAGAASL